MAELTNPVTAQGTYDVEATPGLDYKITITGSWNAASVAIHEYDADADDTAEFPDSPLTANGGFNATAGTNVIRFVVSGADPTGIYIRCSPRLR